MIQKNICIKRDNNNSKMITGIVSLRKVLLENGLWVRKKESIIQLPIEVLGLLEDGIIIFHFLK